MKLGNVLAAAAVSVIAAFATTGQALAEKSEITIGRSHSFGVLQFLVMEHQKLLEKHATAAGIGDLSVNWTVVAGANMMNDGLISGAIDIVTAGVPGFLTLWSKARGTGNAVLGLGAMGSYPIYLNTRNPNVKTLADFTETDRIALPAVKVSIQAMLLQMAAAAEFGQENANRLDHLTVSLSHPDAMAALLSPGSEITSHFATIPFNFLELEKPGITKVISSYDILGGPATMSLAYTTARFREANPKLTAVFLEAFREATQIINERPLDAVRMYLDVTGEKTDPQELLKMLDHPEIAYTVPPENMMKLVDYMFQSGQITHHPASWKEMFVPELHGESGS